MMTKTLLPLILFVAFAYTPADANTASELIQRGDVHDQRFEPEQALKFYTSAEKTNPSDASLMVKIARQHVYRMDDLPSDSQRLQAARAALEYAERAVRLNPRDSDAHLSIAIVLGKMTQFLGNRESIEASKRIKQEAETAARIDPRSDYAWHLLGRWHQALAGMGAVTRGLAKMIYGELPSASNEEAARCFTRAIAINPSRLIHHVELGRTYAQMGRVAEARASITKGLAMPNRDKDDADAKRRGRETLAKLR